MQQFQLSTLLLNTKKVNVSSNTYSSSSSKDDDLELRSLFTEDLSSSSSSSSSSSEQTSLVFSGCLLARSSAEMSKVTNQTLATLAMEYSLFALYTLICLLFFFLKNGEGTMPKKCFKHQNSKLQLHHVVCECHPVIHFYFHFQFVIQYCLMNNEKVIKNLPVLFFLFSLSAFSSSMACDFLSSFSSLLIRLSLLWDMTCMNRQRKHKCQTISAFIF